MAALCEVSVLGVDGTERTWTLRDVELGALKSALDAYKFPEIQYVRVELDA
jgi:hypothetical protein